MHAWKSLLLGFSLWAPAMAQLTTDRCPGGQGAALSATDFTATELFNRNGSPAGTPSDPELSEPTRMDMTTVIRNDSAFPLIFFTERKGNLKLYDGRTKRVSLLGSVPVVGSFDSGLMGVALDPGFDRNRWIYLWYIPKKLLTGQNRELRLSRMTLRADYSLDTAAQKILISVQGSKVDRYHSGGPMTFDAHGDLWVAIGNNTGDLDTAACTKGKNVFDPVDSSVSAEWGPSNTASLRGGFIRIHPDSSEKGYSIPAGNFGKYWSDYFAAHNRADLARDYLDTLKVKPEIYVKGERSNYSIAVHPTKRWLAWGTVNFEHDYDEFNITAAPSFAGFPYFHANNLKTCGHSISPTAPINDSPLKTGVRELPPAAAPLISDLMNVAIGGPIYVFDPALRSLEKFPPHFHNKWLIGSYQVADIYAVTVDSNDLHLVDQAKLTGTGIFKNVKPRSQVQSMFGKDGALYILNYNSSGDYGEPLNPGVMRVAYTGACRLEFLSALPPPPANAPLRDIRLTRNGLVVSEKGRHAFILYDLSGRRIYQAQGVEGAEYDFSRLPGAAVGPGVYLVRVNTDKGEFLRRTSLF